MNSAVGSGPTLEDAVLAALNALGARPDQVVLKKLEEGGPAGLMGGVARPFRVRATWRPEFAPPPPPPPAPKPARPAYEEQPSYDERPRRGREERGGRGGREGRPERRERTERAPRADRPRRPMTPLDPSERFQVDEAFLAKVKQDAEWLLEKLGMEGTVTVAHEEDEVTVSLQSEVDDALLTGRRVRPAPRGRGAAGARRSSDAPRTRGARASARAAVAAAARTRDARSRARGTAVRRRP